MDALLNRIRAEAERAARMRTPQVHGRVTSYDPNQHAAKVILLPDGDYPEQTGDTLESGWIPIATHWIGNGWGAYSPPSVGDQVTIDFSEGDAGSGVIKGRVYDQTNVPLAVNSGEFWLVHKNGQSIKLTNDGNVSIHGTATVQFGNLQQAVQTLCTQALHDWAQNHTHNNAGGTGVSGPPSSAPPSNSLTAIVKAN